MMISSQPRIRIASLLIVMVAALMLAPSAFARGGHNNWGISLGFSGPGYNIGYSDCRNCGGGYVSGSVYGGYSSYGGYGGYSSPGYYGSSYGGYSSPGYYDSYYSYSPSYYSPGYGSAYYGYSNYRSSRHHRRGGSHHVVNYDNYYYNDRRDHRDSRNHRRDRDDRDDHRSSRRHGSDDRGYSRRAAYYDRRN